MALLARVAAAGVRHRVRRPERWPSPTTISYTYDPAGRRIEKQYDGLTQMKYLYDGDHIIAECSGNGGLLHKYVSVRPIPFLPRGVLASCLQTTHG